jgi:surfactin synthase thioesterase subunit
MKGDLVTTDWFISRPPKDTTVTPGAVVFCFPHAGGSVRTFLDWQPGLGVDAQLMAVCRPGREHRAQQPSPTIDELIDGAATAIRAFADEDGRPIYLFGHSLGALVAFEVTRRLGDLPALRHFVASGCSAPSLLPSERVLGISKLEGKAFAEAIGFFGGLPPEVIADEELQEILLPSLIADFHLAVGYHYRPGPPLAVNVSLINGQADPHVGTEQLEPWRNEVREPPVYHWVDGGHFYFEQRPEAATDLLRTLVRDDQHVELI